MAAIILVVGSAASPTAGDTVAQTRLQAGGHTVTLRSDETAEPTAGTYDGVFISATSSAATIGTKYTTVAAPVVCCENGGWWASAGMGTEGSVSGVTSWDLAALPPRNGGFTGAQTIYTVAALQFGLTVSSLGAGGQAVATITGTPTNAPYVTYEAGAALTSGNAAARRVAIGLLSTTIDDLSATGNAVLDAAIAWAYAAPEAAADTTRFFLAAA